MQKKKLFCVALNVIHTRPGKGRTKIGRRWVEPRLEYLHADDAGEARLVYFQSEAHIRDRIDIVSVGEVIGYHADADGKVAFV